MLCTNCHQTLRLDPSLAEKYPEWKCLERGVGGTAGPGPVQHTSSAASVDSGPADFSVINTPGGPPSSSNLGRVAVMTGNLFNLICSSETPIDHPLCQECTDKLLDCLDGQLKMLEEECEDYRALSDSLEKCQEELDMKCLRTELEKLQNEEAALREELIRLEAEEAEVEKQVVEEERELKAVEAEEETLWYQYRNLARELQEVDQDKASVQNQVTYVEQQLDKLQKTNVFNLAFHVWHSGHFGTINGLRLGRLPNVTVEWTEINAAWGQVVLLLSSLARKMNLTFQRYELCPAGNHSYVKCLADSRELPLYCTGGYKFFWDTKFDAAMVAFLDCLEQLRQAIEKGDNNFCMPYKINKDKIVVQDGPLCNEYSVKIQFNSEERWTKAMKCVLTNLKWALAWVSAYHA